MVAKVTWNKNGNWLVSSSRDQTIKLYDIRTMKDMSTFKVGREAWGVGCGVFCLAVFSASRRWYSSQYLVEDRIILRSAKHPPRLAADYASRRFVSRRPFLFGRDELKEGVELKESEANRAEPKVTQTELN